MRVLALVQALSEGDPVTWVEALAGIIARAHLVDDPDALATVECITHAAADETLPYVTRQQLYESASERNLPAIARLFLAASPQTPLPRQLKKQLGPERALRPSDRPLTLGERKAAARTHRRDRILLMIRDPHPAVVAILLDNPHVTEQDVMKMASMRPGVPESLAKVAAHARWSVRQLRELRRSIDELTTLALPGGYAGFHTQAFSDARGAISGTLGRIVEQDLYSDPL